MSSAAAGRGNFGNELNQGTQDVYLTKYDPAGNLQWTQLLGSARPARRVIRSRSIRRRAAWSLRAPRPPISQRRRSANGNNDSFKVASLSDPTGNQTWSAADPNAERQSGEQRQRRCRSANVYIGGQVSGVKVGGEVQTSAWRGRRRVIIAAQSSHGKVLYATAIWATDAERGPGCGDRHHVRWRACRCKVQNGHAIVSKYANGDATTAPVWTEDLGALQNGGSIGGLAVSGDTIYVSGTTSNAGRSVAWKTARRRLRRQVWSGQDAFVPGLTDNAGTSVTPNQVTYVGTSSTDQGGALTVGSDGTVYLAGTTTGTFAGQSRNAANTNNAFVTAIGTNGSIDWTRQFGGADGTSTGQGIAIDTQGSSVLDALGLPRGTVNIDQSVTLSQNTTLRAGDSFQIAIQGTGTYTGTVTVEADDTLQSLADKINNVLLSKGKATVTYANGGEALKIAVNKGVTANLVAGPTDSDALARLGIAAGTIANAPSTTSSSSSTSSGSSSQVFGLGFSGTMDISTSSDAGAAQAQLQNILTNIRNAYRTSNTPASSASSTTPQATGPAPAYLTAQIASYQTALSLFPGANSSSSA